MVHSSQSQYNKVVERMAHKDVVVAENVGHKVDTVHKVVVVAENRAHNIAMSIENMVHKTQNMTHRTHIAL